MLLGMLPMTVLAAEEHEHVDVEPANGYCDICNIATEASVTLYTTKAVTRTFKAGTLIKEALNGILLSQNVEAAALFYKNGNKVGDNDVVPYGYEILEIFALIYYKAEVATCEDYGHKAYYYNTLDDLYYEDKECTRVIGFDTDDGIRAWLMLLGEGATQEPLGHVFSPCENVVEGHLCARRNCKYHETPGMHTFSDDDTCCAECGAPCYVGCPEDPSCSDFYAFSNIFVNNGEPLKYTWYYVGEDVTLEEPLIIAGRDVRLLIADGVTFNAKAGYYCKPGCAFEVNYQSRGESKGKFIGTEYVCYDESNGNFYAEHTIKEGFVCEVCGKSTCKHMNIKDTYEWSADYSSCHGKIACEDCKTVLYDGDGEIDTYQVSSGDCLTKGKIKYTAFFDFGYDEKYVETEYGAHNITESHYCRKCLCDDLMGAKIYYKNMVDILRSLSDDAGVGLKLAQISTQLDAAATFGEVQTILADNHDIFEVDVNLMQFIDYKIKIGDEIERFARSRQYPSSAIKCALKYLPLIEDAADMNAIENIGIKLENNVVLLENTKAEYLQKLMETYLDEQGKPLNISVTELMQIYYGILYASNEMEIVEAFVSLTLDGAKKAAKEVIDKAAGENQSAAMNKIVKKAKAAIEAATTKEDVQTAEQNGLIAIENQFIKEAEEAQALKEAKADAKKAVDEAAGENPAETVSILAQAAKELIDVANTIEEVNTVKEKWTAAIEKAIINEPAALAEAKTAAKAVIDNAVKDTDNDIKNYGETAKSDIDKLTTITAVTEKLSAALAEINGMKAQKAISAALSELEKAVSGAVATKSKAIAKAAKPLIENAESADEANAILADALNKIASEEKTLSDAKTAAKQAVSQSAGEKQSKEMQAIVEETEKKIDESKSTEEVEKAKQEGTAKVEAQKQSEKPTEPTNPDVCPKCGKVHADNFWGKIVCFFNRMANLFRNLFK